MFSESVNGKEVLLRNVQSFVNLSDGHLPVYFLGCKPLQSYLPCVPQALAVKIEVPVQSLFFIHFVLLGFSGLTELTGTQE